MPALKVAPDISGKIQRYHVPGTLRSLRKLRGQLFNGSRFKDGLTVARAIAERSPGREALFWVGVFLREQGRYGEALRAFLRARWFRSGPAHLIADIHLHKAFTWFLLRRYKRMGEALRRAYRLPVKPRTGHNFHITLGAHYLSRYEYRKALEQFALAEEAARRPFQRARALRNQGYALVRLGDRKGARRCLDRARSINTNHDQALELAEGRLVRAALWFDAGQVRRALALARSAARVFHAGGRTGAEALALLNVGYAAGEAERWEESREALDEGVHLATLVRRRDLQIAALACRAMTFAHQELFRSSAADLLRAESLLRGRRDDMGRLFVARARARIAGVYGRWSEMRSAARLGEEVATKMRDLVRIVEFRRLRAEAERRLGKAHAAKLAARSAARLEGIMGGSSPLMRRLQERADKLARTAIPVLIVGEASTGKTAAAKYFHQKSARRRKACVLVRCEQLAFPASDLCGHEEGVGAERRRRRPGWWRRERGGP